MSSPSILREDRRSLSSSSRCAPQRPSKVHHAGLPEIYVVLNFAVPAGSRKGYDKHRIDHSLHHLEFHIKLPYSKTTSLHICSNRLFDDGGFAYLPAYRSSLAPVCPTAAAVAVRVDLHRAGVGGQGFQLAQHPLPPAVSFLKQKKNNICT